MTWNPLALATALQTVPEQNIDVTNSESALIIKMNDYGDLQINILFTSRQMIIETFICPVSSISNPDEFNTFLLRNQKMMPLSSVGISSVQQEEYYIVFGALSLKSSLEDILLEITSLVDNALDLAEITEEYSHELQGRVFMGILKSLFTLGKSFISQAEESIEETQGVRMLEQHIRDAKAELDKAGKSRVDLLARVKLSHDKLKDLRERKASLEARALEALSKNVNPSLINEVAEEIARLENLITAEEQVLSNLEVSRDGVEKAVTATAQRIAQFEQQMEVVKATEAMQRAQQAVTTSTVGASSSVSTAAESLKRLQTRQAERQARLDAAAQLEKVADGRDLDEKLAEAGIGGSNKSSAQDVLARLQRQQGEYFFCQPR